MKTISGRRLNNWHMEKWVVVNNKYIDPEVNEHKEVVNGLPMVEMQDDKALRSRIEDIKQDIKSAGDMVCMKDAREAVGFLELWLSDIGPR